MYGADWSAVQVESLCACPVGELPEVGDVGSVFYTADIKAMLALPECAGQSPSGGSPTAEHSVAPDAHNQAETLSPARL